MLRLLRSISLLTLVLIAGLVAIIGLNYRNTNRLANLFTRPDGTRCEGSCLFGADPVTMTLDQVEKTLLASPALKQAKSYQEDGGLTIRYQRDGLIVRASVTPRPHGVAGFWADNPTLGEFLIWIGTPERFWIQKNWEQSTALSSCSLIFYLPDHAVSFMTKDKAGGADCMYPSQQIASFILMPPEQAIPKWTVPWQGFQTVDFYEALLAQARQNP